MVGGPYQDFAPANLVLCEANTSGWVAQPAATYSNVGFFIVAYVIWKWSRDEDHEGAAWLVPIAALTGLGSIAFHATSTLWGQLVDQSVMFLETSLFIVLNGRRIAPSGFGPKKVPWWVVYACLVLFSIVGVLGQPTAGIALFVAHGVLVAITEVQLIWYRKRRPSLRYLVAALVTLAVSFTLWTLDKNGTLCDPDNHVFTAHAAWHLLGASSFAFWYRHFAQ